MLSKIKQFPKQFFSYLLALLMIGAGLVAIAVFKFLRALFSGLLRMVPEPSPQYLAEFERARNEFDDKTEAILHIRFRRKLAQ